MPRPKSILWVDDEVESLTSHILFLEEQGFAVETATHGDDALVLLQRQPYGVVLLDEQMPGRRGLDLFQAIRAIDHGMPVVMVTKSEEPETLKDAIGAEISDYLIKPVNPRQILSVVTRLGNAKEPGLQDALSTLQVIRRQDFPVFLQRNYAGGPNEGDSDGPTLS